MKRTIKDLDVRGKRVFIRADLNVPIKNGAIGDDTRIRESLPTIQHALDQGATVIVASHLGRPRGKPSDELSLRPVAARLAELLGRPVAFAEDSVGATAKQAIVQAGPGALVLLENLRFHPEEETNDRPFAEALADLADVYINDAFGAAHRAHASTEGIVRYVDVAAAGLLMAKEVEHLGALLAAPARPFVAVLGGAKVSGKIEVIENLLARVDTLLIGGAMAYTFFRARGWPTGSSLVEDDLIDAARGIDRRAAEAAVVLELPSDHVVTGKIEAGAPREVLHVSDAAIGARMGVDIGPATIDSFSGVIAGAKSVVWNGPMGVFEIDDFAVGTIAIARAIANVRGTTVIGGGDSIAAVTKAGVRDRITHISTGGGASLEFLGGRTLPGVAALPDK